MQSLLSFMCLALAMGTALGSQTITALPPPIPPHEHIPPVVSNWELHSAKVSCPRIGEISVSLRRKLHVNIESLQSNNYSITKNDRIVVDRALSEFNLIDSIHAGCLDNTQFFIIIKGFTRDIKPRMAYIRLQGKRLFLER